MIINVQSFNFKIDAKTQLRVTSAGTQGATSTLLTYKDVYIDDMLGLEYKIFKRLTVEDSLVTMPGNLQVRLYLYVMNFGWCYSLPHYSQLLEFRDKVK